MGAKNKSPSFRLLRGWTTFPLIGQRVTMKIHFFFSFEFQMGILFIPHASTLSKAG